MVTRRSPARARALQEFGANIAKWRKLQGLSAVTVSERAFVTRQTLRDIEAGTGTARMDSLFALLEVLGIVGTVVAASDPFTTPAGRALMEEHLDRGRNR